MGVASAVIGGVSALAGLGLSIKQQIDAKKSQEKAEKAAQSAIAGLKQLEYTDKFGDIQVPTLGAELEFQQQQQAMKTGIEALRQEGPSGALGGVTGLERQRSAEALQTAARLEQQEAALELERQRAEQDIGIRNVGLQAGILSQEATGAGQAAADAFAASQTAQAGMVTSLGQLSGAAFEASPLYPEGRGRRDRRGGGGRTPAGAYAGAGGMDSRMRGTEFAFGETRQPFTYGNRYAGVGSQSSLYAPFMQSGLSPVT